MARETDVVVQAGKTGETPVPVQEKVKEHEQNAARVCTPLILPFQRAYIRSKYSG